MNVEITFRDFTPISKEWISLFLFSRKSQLLNEFLDISCAEHYPNQKKRLENRSRTSVTPLSKVCISLHRFSRSSQLLSEILCRYSILDFIHIYRKIS